MSPTLSWRHHSLIQALLSRGPLEEQQLHSIFSSITGKSPDTHQKLFSEYLGKINKELGCVQLELRACRNQYDGHVYYGVVNTVADEQSKLGTNFSAPQIAFYKGIIEAIVQDSTAQGSISNTDALNVQLESQVPAGRASETQGSQNDIPPAFRNFSMSQKEKTLQELVSRQWLCSIADGHFGLGVRSFLDLRSWFQNNDVPICEVCNEAAVKAEFCQNQTCNVRIHPYCLKKKFSQRRAEKVCSGCGTEWNYTVVKGEAAEEREDITFLSQDSLSTEGSARKKSRSCRGSNGSIADPSQTSVPISCTTRLTRSSSRLRSSS